MKFIQAFVIVSMLGAALGAAAQVGGGGGSYEPAGDLEEFGPCIELAPADGVAVLIHHVLHTLRDITLRVANLGEAVADDHR